MTSLHYLTPVFVLSQTLHKIVFPRLQQSLTLLLRIPIPHPFLSQTLSPKFLLHPNHPLQLALYTKIDNLCLRQKAESLSPPSQPPAKHTICYIKNPARLLLHPSQNKTKTLSISFHLHTTCIFSHQLRLTLKPTMTFPFSHRRHQQRNSFNPLDRRDPMDRLSTTLPSSREARRGERLPNGPYYLPGRHWVSRPQYRPLMRQVWRQRNHLLGTAPTPQPIHRMAVSN
ncbi:unnamed protein product [Coffea canephora]|uniref:DH200=94 genomic scaffold, scaffold_1893 n=1 Tax=Coffea canephora TaxID=49390 RepID=A0A068VMF8_COFCA|nr:unnamed protein product [Coffea canephora]